MTLKELKHEFKVCIRECKTRIREIKKEGQAERKINPAGFYLESTDEVLLQSYETRLSFLEDFYGMLKEIKKLK